MKAFNELFKMKNETYDRLKWIAQLGIPAFGTFCYSITTIWNLPFGAEIVGTLTAIDTLLGVILGISTSNYKKSKKTANKK